MVPFLEFLDKIRPKIYEKKFSKSKQIYKRHLTTKYFLRTVDTFILVFTPFHHCLILI